MRTGLLASAVALGALGALSPLGAQDRPLQVVGVRNLAFGTLLPGVPTMVLPGDGAKSGQLDVIGPDNARIMLSMTLPTVLVGDRGGTLPITFGPASAGWSQSQAVGNQTAFDPRAPFTAALSAAGRGSLFLGATLQPTPTQRAGAYSATITIVVTRTDL